MRLKEFKKGFEEFSSNITIIINSILLTLVYLIGIGITSIIAKSNIYPESTILIALAHSIDENTKISIRCSNHKNHDLNLKEILNSVTSKLGCQAGGHRNAAGALIPQEKEAEFIELLKNFSSEKTIIL